MDVVDDTTEVLAMLRAAAGDYLRDAYDPSSPDSGALQARDVDRKLWGSMAELGWCGLCLPEAVDGTGLGLPGATTLAELFGRTAFPVPFVASVCMPSELIRIVLEGSSSAPATEIARMIASGTRIVSVAWQEQAGQLDGGVPATVVRDARVFGKKVFVPAAQADAVFLVHARLDGQPAIVAVDAAAEGVGIERAAAGLGSYATLTFDGAPLLARMPLLAGGAVPEAIDRMLGFGRVALSAQLAGLASGCLEKTIDYVKGRVQFGRPIGSFQTIQHRCVDLHIDTLLAQASWRHAQASYVAAPSAQATGAAISAAKARCAEVALRVARQAVQMHGAMGFAEEMGIGLYLRAAMQGASYLGNSLQHRRRFASERAAAGDERGHTTHD